MQIEEDRTQEKQIKRKNLQKRSKKKSFEEEDSVEYANSENSSNQKHNDSYQYDDFVVKDDQFESDSDYDQDQKAKEKVVLVRESNDIGFDTIRKNKQRLHKKKDLYRERYQDDRYKRQISDEDDENYQQNEEIDFEDFQQIFEPQDLIENYETEYDKAILEKDIPERLQLRLKEKVTNLEELVLEANWIAGEIIKDRNISQNQTQDLVSNITTILQFIKIDNYEVMYIWLHKRQNYTKLNDNGYELGLEDLQHIYEKDLEWNEIIQKKNKTNTILNKIQNELNLLPDQINKFLNYIELNSLIFLEEFLMYELKKKKNQNEIDNLLGIKNTYKKRQQRNFAHEIYKLGIEQELYTVFLEPKSFADNIFNKQLYHMPNDPQMPLEQFARNLTRPQNILLEDPAKSMDNCFNYLAGEYFNNPIIKAYLKNLYNCSVVMNTNPTENGKKINIYNYYYVTKRIRNKKPNNLNLELWTLIRESKQKNLIDFEFVITQDQFDFIVNDILRFYTNENIKDEQWFLARKEAIKILVENYMIPYFQKKLIEELDKSSETQILQKCCMEFKKLINTKPYKSQYFKILSCTIDENENSVFGMINETGDLMNHMTLFNIIKKPQENQVSKKTLYENDKRELSKFIQQYQPNVIIIQPKSIKAQQLKINLGNVFEEIFKEGEEKPFLLWSNMKISSTFAKCKVSQKLLPEFNNDLKEIISAARYIQNPLAETLNLWSDDIKENYLFHINYHPLQNFVNKEKMKNSFEKIICEVVNDQGVDINNCVAYKHLSSPLQFVCGLGPRKANKLINNIQQNKTTIIMKRTDLLNKLTPKVYENAIAFIRINENMNPKQAKTMLDDHYWLDFTRIHPQFYQIAIKIAKESLDNPNDNENIIIYKALQNSDNINQLDLESYGTFISEKNNCNMHYIINFIKAEFNNPYQDNRQNFETKPNEKDIFFSLIQESEYSLKPEMILTVKIVLIDDRGFKVQTSSGLFGIIPSKDIMENYDENEITDQYQVGQFVKAKVNEIVYEKLYLKLTIRPDELKNHKQYLKKNDIFQKYDLVDDDTFVIERELDYPNQESIKKRTVKTFVPRRITHPYFKNIGLRKVLEQFEDKQNGVFIFRPSTSRGQDYINLTWKFFGKVIVHLPIKEGYKSSNETLSKELTLEKQIYNSLDEIIENFIKPCNLYVQQIARDPKFLDMSINQVKENLIEKKKQNRKKTPYCFSFTDEKPQFLILTYVMDNLKVKHELIKVKPSGLVFHGIAFPNLEAQKKFFKEKFKTKQYQSFLDQQPKIELGKQKTFIRVKDEVKEEKREYKREDRYDDRYQSNRYERYEDRDYRDRRERDYRRDDRYQQRDYRRDDRRMRRDRDYTDHKNDRDFDRRRKIEKNYEGRSRNRRDDYQDRRYTRKRSYSEEEPQQQQYQQQDTQQQSNYQQLSHYSPFNNPYEQPTPQRNPNEPRIKFEHA